MFHCTSRSSSSHTQRRVRMIWAIGIGLFLVGLAYSPALLNPRPAIAQTGSLIRNDFEDGTLQGWIPRGGGVVLTNSTEVAQSGTHSLKTAGRTAGFHGPSLDLLGRVLKGGTYQISASVRLVAGQPASQLRATMQRTLADGTNQFDQVAASAANGVTDAAWVTLQGQYSFGADVNGLLLYIESADPTSSYYVDDFSITILVPPPNGPQDNSGIATDFETNSAEGWQPRIGRETLTATAADQHGGSYSLLTTGRQREFDGAMIDVTNKMYIGSQYRISVWVKLAPGEAPIAARVSLQRTLDTATSFHTVVGNTQVTADQWVLLTAVYNYAFNHSALSLYVETAGTTPVRAPSFYIDDFTLTYIPPPEIEQNIPSVFGTLADYFHVGAAIEQTEITGVHGDLLKKHFDSVTLGNAMKPGPMQPTEGTFNFAPADVMVGFARNNNLLVRGHTLVWHQQNPAWLFLDAGGNNMQPTPENKTLLLQRLENHIRGVVSHYRDDVYVWDVLNEIIDPGQANGFRRSPWYLITGTDYIETALRVTHEVAPNAKLYINDYDTTNPVKRMFLYNLARDLKSRGVPLDGIGHQMHNNIDYPSAAATIETINMFAGLGLDNQITEFDLSVYNNSTDRFSSIPEDLLIRQGYRYRDFFDAFRQLKGKISSVTVWGLADDNTWLKTFPITRLDLPLLFDESLKAKHAYWGVVDPLQLPGADVMTSLSAETANVPSSGTASYTITVLNNGRDAAANVSMLDSIPAGTVFQSLTAPAGWSCNTPAAGSGGQVACTTGSLASGASAQFKLAVTVLCSTPDGTQVVNTAAATSTTRDPNLALNNSASANVRVSNPAPVITSLTADRSVIYPPTNKMVEVQLDYGMTDTCDNAIVPSIAVRSSQPANNPTVPDWEVVDSRHVRLRAAVTPGGSTNRVYTITLTATDSSGGSSSRSVNVLVIRLGN